MPKKYNINNKHYRSANIIIENNKIMKISKMKMKRLYNNVDLT